MPTIIDCPQCGRKLRVHEEMPGQEVQCPTCRAIFSPTPGIAPQPPSASPGESAEPITSLALDEPGGLPPARPLPAAPVPARQDRPAARAGWRRCPYCNEDVRTDATWCRFCGEELSVGDGPQPWERGGRRDLEPDRGGAILGLGIAGLICSVTCILSVVGLPLCVAACVMAQRDLSLMNRYEMDARGKGNTVAGLVCAIIGAVISGFCLLFLVLGFLS
jgi:hypothetical protein